MYEVFLFTATEGYRHTHLTTAVEVLTRLGEHSGKFRVYATEECGEISEKFLGRFSCLVFITCGDLKLSDQQKDAIVNFVDRGGGFVGIHSAAASMQNYSRYIEMLGGVFHSHPWTQEVNIIVEDPDHPATRHLPRTFRVKDEVYVFDKWSREKVNVLLRLDPSSVDLSKGPRSDGYYALAWWKTFGSGRVFYTALGHYTCTWREKWFQEHILGGLAWILGLEKLAEIK